MSRLLLTLVGKTEVPVAHIRVVPPSESDGLLARLYDKYADDHGVVDNILSVHSLNPRSMEDHHRLYAWLMRGSSPLSKVQREMIALTVSAANQCFY